MTDPKELAWKLLHLESLTAHEREAIAEHLDAYARILAASPDVREIEAEHALVAKHYERDGLDGSEANEAHRNRATLLDCVRKLTHERDELKTRLATVIDF